MKIVARWLRKVADWIDPPTKPFFWKTVTEYMQWAQESWPDSSGESKRHQVLARLKKKFPHVGVKEFAHTIERVMQGEK